MYTYSHSFANQWVYVIDGKDFLAQSQIELMHFFFHFVLGLGYVCYCDTRLPGPFQGRGGEVLDRALLLVSLCDHLVSCIQVF